MDPGVDPLNRLFELSSDLLGTASLEGRFTRLNAAWRRTLGWTSEELMGEPYLSFVHPDDIERTAEATATLARPGTTTLTGFENRYRTIDEDYRWIHWSAIIDDGVLYFVAKDVTESKVAEATRAETAGVMQAIVESVADGIYVADSDGKFSFVNQTALKLLGYESEAELMGRDPHSTLHHSRKDGTAYPRKDCALSDVRLTGRPAYSDDDTFWRRDGSALPVSFSSSPIELDGGRGSVVAFQDISERKAREASRLHRVDEAQWLVRIRDAIDEDRLVLYAQPIIDLSSGATVHQELLLRMRAKDGSIVAPGEFLPIAERYGLISEIDCWVIRQAVEIAATGAATAFNISGASIGVPAILAEIESALRRTGADPSLLTIEVTETAIMEEVEAGKFFADQVTRLGCSIALDDFGTGWAGLSYLKHFPTQQLKIDMEFVREVATSEADERLVRGIVGLAGEFGLATTAEGIENEETLVKLRELGVLYGQGYLFGRPQPLDGDSGLVSSPRATAVADPEGVDPVGLVRAIFDGFASRENIDAVGNLFDPEVVIRVFATAKLAGREEPYRGHAGVRRYLEDAGRVWDELDLIPTAFHATGGSVIVFGHVVGTRDGTTATIEVLWVWRLREGLVSSVEVFNSPAKA